MFLINHLINKKLIILFTITILIIITLILFIDSQKPKKLETQQLTDIDKVKSEAISLGANPIIKNSGTYEFIIKNINSLDNSKLSKEEKYKAFGLVMEAVLGLYSNTNNNNLYKFQITLQDFYKLNFPDKTQNNLKPMCLDTSCAEHPQPEEILKVINEIKESNMIDPIKQTDIQNLTNFGYLGDDRLETKAGNYLILAEDIKNSKHYLNAGLNEKIYNQIVDYVKKTYPKEYETFLKNYKAPPKVENNIN